MTIEHGCGALQYFGALQTIGFDFRLGVSSRTEREAQSVTVSTRHEAAHGQPVMPHIGVRILGDNPWRVAQDLRHSRCALCFHLLSSDHINGLWCVLQRCAGLGPRRALHGDDAVYRPPGVFSLDLDRVQLRRAISRKIASAWCWCRNGNGRCIREGIGEPGARKNSGKCLLVRCGARKAWRRLSCRCG
ncbi:hypothetical protein D3C80_1463970 [compost metagenome]